MAYPWYSKENLLYVNNLIESGEVSVYWNDVDCYYWVPSVLLPSGNTCDFFCYNGQYSPKHQPCEIQKWVINPTLEQLEKLEAEKREKEREEWNRFLMEEEKRREKKRRAKNLAEASENLGKCMRALIYIDKVHKEYF